MEHQKDQAFEIRVPDRSAFLDAVSKTITKGFLNTYKRVDSNGVKFAAQEASFAVIDTETNFQNEVMSIGVVIANAATYEVNIA